MKKQLFYFYALGILILFSCSNSSQNLKSEQDSIRVSIDTIVIKISANEQPYYYAVDGYIDKLTKHPIFIGYNHYSHSFDHFDIVDKKLAKKIVLEERGPNGIPMNGTFKFIKNDTIIYRNQDRLFILDLEGRVQKRINLFDFIENTDYLFRRGGITLTSPSNNIIFENGELYSSILHREYFYWDDLFYNQSFIARINIGNGHIKYLNTKYPSEASSENQFGQLLTPFTLIVDNYLIYNFPFSSKIFRLNLETQKLEEFDVQSAYTENTCNPLKTRVNFNMPERERTTIESDQFLSTAFFHKVVYDNYRNVFYRIHNGPHQNKGVTKGKYYLCVFDTEFKKIGEVELDSKLYLNNYFLTDDGLVIQIANNDNIKDIDKLKLCRVKIDY